ncbi:MAG: RNA polymerase sigma factor [Patescibacteria group bacterium]
MTLKQKAQAQELFENAYQEYRDSLSTYAFFKVNDKATSEDLVQNTFIKTWTYLLKGGNIEMMKAFLYHVLNNLIIDQYRKRKTLSLDQLLDKGFEPSVSTNETSQLHNILDGKKAFTLIDKLPKKYQQIMKMRYGQDLSLQEISSITKESRNTLAVQAHRGLEKLKTLCNPT